MSSPGVAVSPIAPASDRIDFPLVRLALVLMFAAVIALLDTTIVNVAIDRLAAEFRASITTIQWVSTAYLLAVAVAIPVSGWAIDRFGGRAVWLASTAAFLAGSLLAGLAWNAPSLIAFRVVQGLGGGMIEPVVMATIVAAAGPRRVQKAMGLVMIPLNLGPVIGPIAGGLIVDQVHWRWIFLVNIPLGFVALLLGWRFIPRDDYRQREAAALDVRGILLLPPGFALVIYALTAASEHGSLLAPAAGWPSLAGIILLAGYVIHALTMSGRPLLEIRLFTQPRFALATISIAAIASIGFATIFLLPLYYQLVHDASALRAGLLVAPFGIGAALGMTVVGILGERGSVRTLGVVGSTLLIVSSFGLAQVERGLGDGWISLFTGIRGLGMSLVVGPLMASVYGLVAPPLVARATTAMYIVFQLGASIGVALSAVILDGRGAGSGDDALPAAFARIFIGQAALAALVLLGVLAVGLRKTSRESAHVVPDPANPTPSVSPCPSQ